MSGNFSDYRFSLAPMMNRSDRHMRYFFRLLSRRALLYSEMLHAGALVLGGRGDLLWHSEFEYPLACQLGGSDRDLLGEAAFLAWSCGYGEVNMNVGCPSARVREGDFGACLMRKAHVVGDCLRSMRDRCDAEITMKCRIGLDGDDSYGFLRDFVGEVVSLSGIERLILHARIAKLDGLSPKENREIPPLRYDRVYRLKRDFPHLRIVLNGGIASTDDCLAHLRDGRADGVMIGRAAISEPFAFADIDRIIYGDSEFTARSRVSVFADYVRYCESMWRDERNLFTLLRPLSGLFHGVGGAKSWRHSLACIVSDERLAGLRSLHKLYEAFEKSHASFLLQRTKI